MEYIRIPWSQDLGPDLFLGWSAIKDAITFTDRDFLDVTAIPDTRWKK